MDAVQFMAGVTTEPAGLHRGVVTDCTDDELEVFVLDVGTLLCDFLQNGASIVPLRRGDPVLIWHSGRETERGVVLGRLGAPQPKSDETVASHDTARVPGIGEQLSDELVIEAKRSLTLRVGNGSITIREDGKILIKGSDLVSHATRMNRVRGAAVAIN